MTGRNLTACFVALAALLLSHAPLAAQQDAPFDYVPSRAYHILPETTTDESGYFSLCQGLNGKIYVGTAAYGRNAYLVEFDPKTERQRIVIDIQEMIGEHPRGMKAQSKIHTRNYVGESGKIYVGTKQGYPVKGENPYDYPGGYLATYDPATDKAELIDKIPFRSHGVGDVVADEDRGLLYICTQDDAGRHALWVVYDMNDETYHTLHSNISFYAMTLKDRTGRAHTITSDNRIVTYDPSTDDLRIRPMMADGERLTNENGHDGSRGVPTWIVMPDGETAYLIYMSEPTLYRLDLMEDGESFTLETLGDMITPEKGRIDTRCALDDGPDGKVYNVIRENNTTGFGKGFLHHLTSYDPKTGKITDHGVLTVSNPDYFGYELGRGGHAKNEAGENVPWSHGFHRLPDDTLTPLYAHLAMIVSREGDVYTTILYPFTLLRTPNVASRPLEALGD